jgi:outer membrane biosynthesis protein TonB
MTARAVFAAVAVGLAGFALAFVLGRAAGSGDEESPAGLTSPVVVLEAIPPAATGLTELGSIPPLAVAERPASPAAVASPPPVSESPVSPPPPPPPTKPPPPPPPPTTTTIIQDG